MREGFRAFMSQHVDPEAIDVSTVTAWRQRYIMHALR